MTTRFGEEVTVELVVAEGETPLEGVADADARTGVLVAVNGD